MKRNIVGAMLLSVLPLAAPLSTARAADLPVKTTTPVASPAPLGPLWAGLFVGGNIGYAWSKVDWCTDAIITNCQGPGLHDVVSQHPSGIVGGGTMAYRFQYGNFVFGPEAMLDAMTIKASSGDPVFAGQTRTSTLRGLMSVTGDAGIAFDRVLLYGKGGWALSHVNTDAYTIATTNDLQAAEYVQGWTAGAGIEYSLPSGFTIGVEYNYYGFHTPNMLDITNSVAGAVIPCAFCNFGNTSVQTIMARLQVRVGPPPGGL